MPPMTPDEALQRAEGILVRLGGTREARDATLRSVGRTARDIGTRVRRGLLAMGGTGLGLGAYEIAMHGVLGVEGLVIAALAIPAAGTVAALLPTRRAPEPRKFNEIPLGRLAADAEEWLIARKPSLPRSAWAPADQVIARLHEIQPLLAERAPGDADAIEARRLIADHLPRLVSACLAVPQAQRAPDVEREAAGGFTIIAEELKRLAASMAAAKLDALKVEGRFLESRYGDRGTP